MNIATLTTGKKRIRIIARTLFHILSAVISTIEKIGLDGKMSTLTRQIVDGRTLHFAHIVSEHGEAELLVSRATAEELVKLGYFSEIVEVSND